ncbi:MAG TPA: hypothetical protein VFF21_00840 [Flavobacteriaceae bacterium]|nr:hypothetical protein [Flavobacteriaceae bacterium]
MYSCRKTEEKAPFFQMKGEKEKKPEVNRSYTRYEENLEFLNKWRESRFWLVRATYVVAASVWAVVMVIGGFLAWLIATLFI